MLTTFFFFFKHFPFLSVPFHVLVDLQRFKSSRRLLLWEDVSFMYIKYNCSSCFVYTALSIFNRGDGVVLCLMQVSVRLMQSERFTLMVSAVVNIVAGSVMSRGLEGMKQEYRSSLSFLFFPPVVAQDVVWAGKGVWIWNSHYLSGITVCNHK